MSYATQQDLVERFGTSMLLALTDRAEPPADVIDAEVVSRALDDTAAVIDGYLKGRYTLPLASTPPLVRDLSLAISIYKLHRDVSSDKIRRDYEDALKQLKQIADGIIRLDVAGVEPASSGSNGVQFTDRERPFTADNLKGFI